MRPVPALFFLVLSVMCLLSSGCGNMKGKPEGKSQALNPVAADSLIRHIEHERKQTEEWLKTSASSYLATVQRVDFGNRLSLTVGRGKGNDVRVDDPEISDRHLRITVRGDSFLVERIDKGSRFSVRGTLQSSAVLPPSAIGFGRFALRLSHQGFPGLIVFDPSSPRFSEYKGLKYFPVDLRYRYTLPLHLNPESDTVTILSTRGNRRKALRVGWFDFDVEGIACRLGVTRLLEPGVGEVSYSIFFRDLTCGHESYPLGRYVEAEEQRNGLFVLDFNNAYNPACAFSAHYNCPVPPEENHLPVRIPAGEMDAHYMEH
jgi:uncharacterized protein (DUF1684 family)